MSVLFKKYWEYLIEAKQSLKDENLIKYRDKGGEFYNNSFKKSLKDNDIEMYSIHNEGKSAVAERFMRALKNKIYKYVTSKSKMCISIN